MKKFKKAMALSLAAAMGLSLAACGNEEKKETTTAEATTEAVAETTEAATGDDATDTDVAEVPELDLSSDGKVFNIHCWNEEFKSRLTDHYPGYEEVDATTGKVGDITVNWLITPSTDNAYQNALDEALLAQESAADDDKVDLFLVEADYALKYVDTDYTMPVADLGISDAELANQYQYTKDIVTDSNGQLKGVSWQGCPGVLIYNRQIAKDVLGSDDPADVQEYVKDWDTFNETAATLKEAGYQITSSVNDTFRTYSNNVSSKWVVDGKVNIDDNIKAWAEASKALYDSGETNTYDLWGSDWSKGFYPDGKVFCYFGPAWFIDFSMSADDEASIAAQGGWGATEGPQGFFWGGTWICGAQGSDNPALIADIMRQLTTNENIMTDIVKADNDFVNNKPAMEAMAADTSYQSKVLGGQNALAMFCAGADKVDLSNLSAYDQGCNEEFQIAMKGYFEGTYASYDDAVAAFNQAIVEKYPSLTAE